jgi:hypothetical protein
MSNINSNVIRLYGGMPSGDVQIQQGAGPSNAGVSETLAVGTTRRLIMGPKSNAHYSLQVFVDAAAGATSAMTVWYANHPNPSLTSDNDWSQDLTIGSIDLTITGNKFFNVGNVNAEYIMLKAVIVTSTGNVRAFLRIEGTTHGKVG